MKFRHAHRWRCRGKGLPSAPVVPTIHYILPACIAVSPGMGACKPWCLSCRHNSPNAQLSRLESLHSGHWNNGYEGILGCAKQGVVASAKFCLVNDEEVMQWSFLH